MPNAKRMRAVACLPLLMVLASLGCQPDAGQAAARSPERPPASTVATGQAVERPPAQLPSFTPEGELVRPEGWEAWVMVGASIGLSYSEDAPAPVPGAGPGMFHNIFMQPWAYEHFRETGEFAEETMFILAIYPASREADPAQQGFYEGDLAGAWEVHLKKEGLHESGWAFYGFGGEAASARMIPGEAACYSCHAEKAERDEVFVQFYPPLRRVPGPEREEGK